ncbi:50S ribosomal protein L25/general stress protein Ctc [uncultured Sphingomonas sp.]|jgi:large subunit ribosomal protein L25|uniref:50S ribosomal protein L25/general stress protein Ctc n=1 Tax=uncultured Sphingomonas sp. TaxID=158754 RepID=UPI002588B865|nr:50S ribosomal protein L25/general stress protein Ctc [uncultured Sphingomonas sp.]
MSDTITLAAETRDRVGKGASRALRRDGRVPAVIYGQKKEPVSIHLEEKALVKALMTGHFMNSVIMVDGQRTLAKDVAFHPVTDRPTHVDFLRIAAHETVTVPVPVVIVDEELSPGVKKGAVLTLVATELELTVDAADIPSEIVVSVKGKDVGDTIHIGDVRVPKGATLAIEDPEFTVATIVAPSAMLAEAQEQAAEEAALAEAASAEAAAEAAAEEEEGEDKGE